MEPINLDTELLEAALAGYERHVQEIHARMSQIRIWLARAETLQEPVAMQVAIRPEQRKRRHMTEETKARIAAAQKARWEKRKMAASGLAAINAISKVG
jgi:hypothetical protein